MRKSSKTAPKVSTKTFSNRTEKNQIEVKPCVSKVLEEFKLVDVYLKGVATHPHDQTNEEEFKSSYKESMKILSISSYVVCSSDDEIKSMFKDRYLNQNKTLSHRDLCIKKYSLENQIIDQHFFNIDSTLINVTDCDDEIKTFLKLEKSVYTQEFLFGLPLNIADQCIVETPTPSYKVGSLPLFDISEIIAEKVGEFESEYVEAFRDMFKNTLKCFGKLL